MQKSLFVRSLVLCGAVLLAGGFVYWRAFAAARPAPPANPEASPTQTPGATPGARILPGSKSAIVIDPSSPGYPGEWAEAFSPEFPPIPADVILPGSPANAAVTPAPAPAQPVATPVPSPVPRRQFLPGSKSMVLPEVLPDFSAPGAAPPAPNQAAQQEPAASRPRAANPAARPRPSQPAQPSAQHQQQSAQQSAR